MGLWLQCCSSLLMPNCEWVLATHSRNYLSVCEYVPHTCGSCLYILKTLSSNGCINGFCCICVCVCVCVPVTLMVLACELEDLILYNVSQYSRSVYVLRETLAKYPGCTSVTVHVDRFHCLGRIDVAS